jgi:hypothetical protein
MVRKPNEIVIIGGGNSVQEGLRIGLGEVLASKCVIALNYAFRYVPSTFMCFVDKELYHPNQGNIKNGKYVDISEELKPLPLIIGSFDTDIDKMKYPNTHLFPVSGEYHREDSLTKGIYKPTLCGLFGLTIAAYLLDFKGTIYLLGYDWSRNDKEPTHFYSDIHHRGMGYTSFYERHKPEAHFKPYLEETNLKIYNVSLNSNIDCFEKISYPTMLDKLNNISYNQEELRTFIKEALCIK